MSKQLKIAPLAAALMAAVLLLAACTDGKLPWVYRPDIQQGNVVTQEMLDQVELGMDGRKVRFILGTPLLTDTFNDNRWDYFYSLKKGSGERVDRNVSLFFENDRLVRIQKDPRGAKAPEGAQRRTDTIVTVPAERPKKGFFAGLVPGFLKKSPAKRGAAVAATTETPKSAEVVASADESKSNASPGAVKPVALSAEDSAFLQKLFEGYGQLDGG